MRKTLFFMALVMVGMSWLACGEEEAADGPVNVHFEAPIPKLMRLSHEQFGIEEEPFKVVQAEFQDQQFLRDVLLDHAVSPATIEEIAQKSKEVFDVRKMRAGRPYTILQDKKGGIEYFVYEINESDYVVIDLTDSVRLYAGQRVIDLKEREVAGQIESSLFESVEALGVNGMLAQGLEDIFGWTVDFRDLKKGDQFKIVYVEQFVNGISMGISHIEAAMIEQDGEQHYAILFPSSEGESAYFDETGRDLHHPFLKSPLKYAEGVDKYSLEGLDWQLAPARGAHLGAHFLAPKGSEVYAIGEGLVLELKGHKQMGKTVRIKHNGTYTTQYQHLDRYTENLLPKMKIQQGDLIGYVGNSGSVRKPQVCLRMWENGKEINPLRLSLPKLLTIDPQQRKAFEKQRKLRLTQLKALPVKILTKSYVLSNR